MWFSTYETKIWEFTIQRYLSWSGDWVGSLDNVNVFNVFMLVVLVLIRAGGSELNCWLHSLHLSFVTKEVKSLFARQAPTESTTRWL